MNRIKGIIFVICLSVSFGYAYYSYSSLNEEKERNTQEFLSKVKIREDDFYMDDVYREEILSNVKEEIVQKDRTSKNTAEQKQKFYYLQVGTFSNKENAENLKDTLNNIAVFKVIKSPHNDKYYILISVDYSKDKVDEINKRIKEKYDSLSPIIKVRY